MINGIIKLFYTEVVKTKMKNLPSEQYKIKDQFKKVQEVSIVSLKDELRRVNAEKKELEERLQNALEAENAMHQLYLQAIILKK